MRPHRSLGYQAPAPETMLDDFYRVSFRKKLYRGLEELQADLDEFLAYYKPPKRTHQGRWCGKTPIQTFTDSLEMAKEKLLSTKLRQSA